MKDFKEVLLDVLGRLHHMQGIIDAHLARLDVDIEAQDARVKDINKALVAQELVHYTEGLEQYVHSITKNNEV